MSSTGRSGLGVSFNQVFYKAIPFSATTVDRYVDVVSYYGFLRFPRLRAADCGSNELTITSSLPLSSLPTPPDLVRHAGPSITDGKTTLVLLLPSLQHTNGNDSFIHSKDPGVQTE